MRSLKARKIRGDEAVRGGGRRGKTAGRAAETRRESRRRRREANADEGSSAGGGRGFASRRPMLVLTLGLIVVGGAAGLFAGGHVAQAIDRTEAGVAASL